MTNNELNEIKLTEILNFMELNDISSLTEEIINEKYKKLALLYHPDKRNGDTTKVK